MWGTARTRGRRTRAGVGILIAKLYRVHLTEQGVGKYSGWTRGVRRSKRVVVLGMVSKHQMR